MKLRCIFKNPDYWIDADNGESGNSDWFKEYRDILSNWIEYDEYVTIEIDTETGKARVLPVK